MEPPAAGTISLIRQSKEWDGDMEYIELDVSRRSSMLHRRSAMKCDKQICGGEILVFCLCFLTKYHKIFYYLRQMYHNYM
jgi:hypothetical protein